MEGKLLHQRGVIHSRNTLISGHRPRTHGRDVGSMLCPKYLRAFAYMLNAQFGSLENPG